MPIDLKDRITCIDGWPKPGIMTYDIAPLFRDSVYFQATIEKLAEPYLNKKINFVVGIEARGFVIASALAARLGVGLVLIRKKGKIPPPTIAQDYSYEYSSQVMEIQATDLKAGDQVIIVDDTLATGGTMAAAVKLVGKLGAEIIGLSFIVYRSLMAGEERLRGQNINYLVSYQ